MFFKFVKIFSRADLFNFFYFLLKVSMRQGHILSSTLSPDVLSILMFIVVVAKSKINGSKIRAVHFHSSELCPFPGTRKNQHCKN